MTISTKRFDALDGLRGVAALAVVWFHVTEVLQFGHKPASAFLAVDFFFCLSGFVIAHAYETRLTTGLSLKAFVRERLIRLMPLAMAGTLLGGLVLVVRAVLMHDAPLPNVIVSTILNVFLLPSGLLVGLHPDSFPANGPMWSLSCEVVINIIYAVAIPRLSNRVLSAVIAISGVTLLMVGIVNKDMDVGFRWVDLPLGYIKVFFGFSAGVALHRFRPIANNAAVLLGAALAAILLAIPMGWMAQIAIVVVAFPLIVLVGAGSVVEGGARKAFVLLGKMSYPLYALHHPIIRIVKFAESKAQHIPALAFLVTAMLVPIAVALALVPLDEWVRARLKTGLHRPAARPLKAV